MQVYLNTAKLTTDSARIAAFDDHLKHDHAPAKVIFSLYADETGKEVANWYLNRLQNVQKLEIETQNLDESQTSNVVDFLTFLARKELKVVLVNRKFQSKSDAAPYVLSPTGSLRVTETQWIAKLFELWVEDNGAIVPTDFSNLTEICNYAEAEWTRPGVFVRSTLELCKAPVLTDITFPISFWKSVQGQQAHVTGQNRIAYCDVCPPIWNLKQYSLSGLYIGSCSDPQEMKQIVNMCKMHNIRLYVESIDFEQVVMSPTLLAAAESIGSLSREDVGSLKGANEPRIWKSQQDALQPWVVKLQLNVYENSSSEKSS